jgi:hypothetical protein
MGLAGFAIRGHAALADASGSSVDYPAGLSLISAPPGSSLTAVDGQLSTYQSGAHDYQQSGPAAGTTSGYGYWAQFTSPATLVLASGSNSPYTTSTIAGQWIMIGDPSGSLPATVAGASAVYIYDPSSGYKPAGVLQPGQGAWAQASGQMVIVRPQTLDDMVAAAKLRSITANGFSVGVPNDWDRLTVKPAEQSTRAEWTSADGRAGLIVVGPTPLSDGTRINATRVLNNFLNDPKFLDGEQVTQSAAQTVVPGADVAATGALTGVDPKFGQFQESLVLAIVNQSGYLFDLTASLDFRSQNQELLDEMVQSFQMTER